MSKMFKKTKIIRVNNQVRDIEDLIALDSKIELDVNGKKLGKFYLSPFNLEDFTLGYLLDERYIKSLKDVNKIEFKPSSIQVFLKTLNPMKTAI